MGRPSRLSGRFRPVGPPTDSVVYQRQGTARCSAGAFPVPVSSPRSHSGCLLRQHHSGDLPSHGGWLPVSSPQHLGSGDLALDGVPLHPPGSTVPSGLRRPPSRRPFSPSPAPTYRVVSKHDRLSIFEKTLACSTRFICHLSQSSLFDLLLPFRGSEVSRHGRVSPVLGRPSGLRVPSSGCHSACSREAPSLQGDGTHSRDSPTGPSALGSRPWSSFRWLLQCSCRPVQTSCACLGLVTSTRISVGSGFMPGDTLAIYQSRWLLLRCRGAVFAGAPSILARSVSGTVVHLSWVVSLQWPFRFSSYLG